MRVCASRIKICLSAGRAGAARITRSELCPHKMRHEKSPIYFLFFTWSPLHPPPLFAIITFAQQNMEYFDTKYRFGLCLMAETVFGVFFCVHFSQGELYHAKNKIRIRCIYTDHGVLCRITRASDFPKSIPPGIGACYLYMNEKSDSPEPPRESLFFTLMLFFYLTKTSHTGTVC